MRDKDMLSIESDPIGSLSIESDPIGSDPIGS